MPSVGWRLQIWMRRLIPFTPIKRWAYAAGLAVVVAVAVGVGGLWAACALMLLIAVRLLDVQLGRRRSGRMPTQTAYFFEGEDPRRR